MLPVSLYSPIHQDTTIQLKFFQVNHCHSIFLLVIPPTFKVIFPTKQEKPCYKYDVFKAP